MKYQIPLGFELEVPLETYRACNPPSSQLILYKEYFSTGLRLPLFSFFVELYRAIGLSLYAVMPNTWRFIYSFSIVRIQAKICPTILLFRAFFFWEIPPILWMVVCLYP